LGERFFQAQIGSNVRRSLFELNDSITAGDLKYHIQQTIQNNEPRVSLIDVVVALLPTQDSVHINIVFAIINTNIIQNLELLLKRVR
jgi:phage baseplate assembly protein W